MYSDLRRIREEKGFSVKELAELSGISEEKINEIENGIFPEMDELARFAKEHEIDPIELLELEYQQLLLEEEDFLEPPFE